MSRVTLGIKLFLVLTIVISIHQLAALAHAIALRTVALSGNPAPGIASGVTYDSFGSHYDSLNGRFFRGPVLNDAGQVAFRADLAGIGTGATNNQGVWSEGSGSLSLVARTGSQAPGAPGGVNFRIDPAFELFSPVLNDAGQTAFYGGLTNGSIGFWSEGSGDLALVARSGVQAPGAPAGVNLSFSSGLNPFHLDWPKLNNSGQTLFVGSLTGAGVNSTNNWGVWSNAFGSLELVARAGDQVPGGPSGMTYGTNTAAAPIPVFSTALNHVGRIALWANVSGTGVVDDQSYGIWSGHSKNLTLAALSGDAAPGTPSGVRFEILSGPVALNNLGQIVLGANLVGTGVNNSNLEGLWSNRSGNLELIARRGSQAAGTPIGVNYLFGPPSYPVLNDAGKIAFRSYLTGSGVNSTNELGIWSDGSGELTLVARTGSQAPGTDEGVNFFDLHLPSINSAGQTAFRANLIGDGVDVTNNRGIWATDTKGALQLIVRTGNQMEVAPGDVRTIGELDFVTATGNGDSRPSAFNNFGQLVFWASFTDGSQGVFVSNAVAHVPGDFNSDGTVDAADYVVWRKGLGTTYDQNHYGVWRSHFGASLGSGSGSAGYGHRDSGPGASTEPLSAAIPEPGCGILVAVAGLSALIMSIVRNRTNR
jgi:hypothetical protein